MTKVSDAITPTIANPQGAAAWTQSVGQGLKTHQFTPTATPDAGTFTHDSAVYADDRYMVYRLANRLWMGALLVSGTLSGVTAYVDIEFPIATVFPAVFPVAAVQAASVLPSYITITGKTGRIALTAGSYAPGAIVFSGSITYFTT
jgi:hypothetical protein